MSALRLYSPVNFFVGVQVVLAKRSRLDVAQALVEAEREAPKWPYRLAASLITGLLLLYVLFSALPRTAETAMSGLSRHVTSGQVFRGIAVLVTLAALWLALAVLRRAWRFYAAMCRIGHLARLVS